MKIEVQGPVGKKGPGFLTDIDVNPWDTTAKPVQHVIFGPLDENGNPAFIASVPDGELPAKVFPESEG